MYFDSNIDPYDKYLSVKSFFFKPFKSRIASILHPAIDSVTVGTYVTLWDLLLLNRRSNVCDVYKSHTLTSTIVSYFNGFSMSNPEKIMYSEHKSI